MDARASTHVSSFEVRTSTKDPPKAKAETKDPEVTSPTPVEPEPTPVPSDRSPRQGRVFVEAQDLGDSGPALAGRANRAAADSIVAAGVAHTDAPAGPELRIVLSARDDGGYRLDYQIVYEGKPVDQGQGSSECQLCTENELIAHVEALSREVAPHLIVPEPEPVDPPKDDPPVVVGPAVGGTDDVDRPPLKALGKAGIGVLVVGVVAAGVGAGLVIRKPQHFREPSRATELTTTRPIGWAMLGSGVAVAVVGGVMLAVDLRRNKSKNTAAESSPEPKAEAALHPWVGAGSGGLSLRGRF
ncbi:MAG: hypothetical protein K0V04_29495 [Deltaproteobacteria bacterium]|nr:hypothetical protein [Deltaproteobacteria bacterium]